MFVDIHPIVEELRDTNALLSAVLDELRELRAAPPGVVSILPANVPPGATLVVNLPADMLNVEYERTVKELAAHFGGRRVLAFRAGDVKLGYIAFEDV